MKFEPKVYKIEQLLYAEQRLKKMLERKNKHEATLRQVIKEKEALFLFNNEDNKRIEEIIESINYGSTNDIDFLWIETFIAMVKTSSFQKSTKLFLIEKLYNNAKDLMEKQKAIMDKNKI